MKPFLANKGFIESTEIITEEAEPQRHFLNHHAKHFRKGVWFETNYSRR